MIQIMIGGKQMYLIPKNIKIKHEIFRGYGIKEIILIGISIITGFLISKFLGSGIIKVFYFSFFPILTFLITLPIPNGNGNILNVLIKLFKFKKSQKKYKRYFNNK